MLLLSAFILLTIMSGCTVAPIIPETNKLELAQEKILKRDYEGAREVLSKIYEKSDLKTEKGEALYWIAYTHIKENAYSDARNYLETADKVYRSGSLLGAISSRIIACALLDADEARANKQYVYIQDKHVGEMPEIDFIMGKYFQKKGDLAQAKSYFQKCSNSGDNLFARKANYHLKNVAEGIFYLQVGAYSNMKSVNMILQKLKTEYSLDAYVKETKINENKLNIICIGKYSTREEADKELKSLKSKFRDLDLIIRP